MMSTKEDFLKWDDLPLEYILGEFTEDDVESSESGSESESDEIASEMVLPPFAKRQRSSAKNFKCPDCNNSYASISGFRGHVTKKHNKPHLKASEHRIDNNDAQSDAVAVLDGLVEGDCCDAESNTCLSDATIRDLVINAIKRIEEDPFINVSSEKSSLTAIAASIVSRDGNVDEMMKHLKDFISVTHTSMIKMQGAQMWTRYHELMSDETYCAKITELLLSFHCQNNISQRAVSLFSACLHDELLKCIAAYGAKLLKQKSEEKVDALSDNDKGVLYYVAGHVLFVLLKKTTDKEREAQIKHLCLSGLVENAAVPRQWLEYRDRGGLTEPSAEFFELVVSLESVLRKEISMDSLTPGSLKACKLLEIILADLSVQQQWEKVTSGKGHQSLLEAIINYFLRIRGHAVVKVVNEKQKQDNVKKSSSLRKNLKHKGALRRL
ncbi:uncharacterized protein [Littorina saxatilis]|uniref:uncharacterized protein n=1 Tax=Littorina saxatilis TaxID=31220 RepID=UPI0038B57D1C